MVPFAPPSRMSEDRAKTPLEYVVHVSSSFTTNLLPPPPQTLKKEHGGRRSSSRRRKTSNARTSQKKPTQGTRTEEQDKDWLQNATPSSLPRGGEELSSPPPPTFITNQSSLPAAAATSVRRPSHQRLVPLEPSRTKSEKKCVGARDKKKKKSKGMDDEPSSLTRQKKAMTNIKEL